MNYLGNYFIQNGEVQLLNTYNSNEDDNKHDVYEVIRVEDGIPLFIHDHLNRLKRSFIKLNYNYDLSNNKIIQSIQQLIHIDHIINDNIKISCNIIDDNDSSSYFIFRIPSYYPSDKLYEHGVKTITLDAERPNPNIKIANTKVRITANQKIANQHVFEALLINHNGYITEGSRTNLFFIKGDTIYTAPSDLVLEGIIRSKVMEIIEENNYSLKTECIHTSSIDQLDAAFITGTSSRILPIQQIENKILNTNHQIIKDLTSLLQQKINNYKTKNAGTH
ncbi:aminotransferase class IV [Labilibacter sediminis]|nr:aminotransferase class IV [Labilibacter sediminis]